ncbi:TonB-dependent receptor plug domain-containing protein [Myxococcus xanthus]|uniref:TonB-dependent receptor n=1 Tax=Myxococcus xanthus TaxID=34 RepID=A0A7Y4IQB6_MYXXA|nr:TonB-dependent receptor [Myxococcus xanthus]NOJ83482.1 TonB-dependent receptor [Myxococcus xanthus]NOJ87384.1 TonB-dependent receptor [Myxococcus xanthus]
MRASDLARRCLWGSLKMMALVSSRETAFPRTQALAPSPSPGRTYRTSGVHAPPLDVRTMHSTLFGEPRLGAAKAVAGRRALRAGLPLSIMLCVLSLAVPSSAAAQAAAEAEAPAKVKRRKRVVKPAASARPAAKTAKKSKKPVKPPVENADDPTAEPEIPVLGGGPATDEPSPASAPAPVPTPPAAAPLTPAMPLTAEPASPQALPPVGADFNPPDAPTHLSPATATLPAHPPAPASNIPISAPFAEPTLDRPLPPQSGLAGLGVDPLDGADALEESVNRVLSEAVVTTAGKRNQRISDVPLTVSWIPADELEGTGQFTLCEAIQYFPGMECRRGSMRKAAVSARGLGSNYLSNRLLLLQDGRPLTDPWTGQFYADETTPLTNLKQVEVIRGPGSSLYGSNAFSGVINVIQRQPSDLIEKGKNVGAEARVLAGQDQTWRLHGTVAGRGGPVEALLGYYGFGSDGPQLFNDPRVGRVDTNQDSLVHQVNGKVRIGPLALDADFTDAEIGRPGGTHISTVGNCGRCHYTPNDSESVQNFNASAQVDQQVTDNLRLFGQAYGFFKRRDVLMENAFGGDPTRALGKRRRLGGEARALWTVGDLNVTFGGDLKADAVNVPNVLPELSMDDTRQTILGGFVDAEYRLFNRLVFGAGARYDRYQIPERVWQNRTDQVSPRASVVFHAVPELLTLRTNYGRAFRAPTLAELAINQQMYAATLVGNSNLRAETLDTIEASVDFWPFDRRVRLTGTGFYNLAKNFINQQLVFGSVSQFQNLGDARVAGFELEAAAQIPSINSSFDIAYQFLDAKALPYDDGPQSPLDYAPAHRIYARGRTNIGKVAFVELYALLVGSRYDPGFEVDETTGLPTTRVQLPSYVTASARVGFNVYDGISVSFLGSNLFNAKYEESHGFPAPPQSFFSEVKVRY